MTFVNAVPASDLSSQYDVPHEQIVEWIQEGHLLGEKRGDYWYVSLPQLITFHALRAGRSPEEARAEQAAAFAHTRVRFQHTPVGTKVTDEELEKRRG